MVRALLRHDGPLVRHIDRIASEFSLTTIVDLWVLMSPLDWKLIMTSTGATSWHQ